MRALEEFFKDERGTETVEWAIIVGLIAVASIATILSIGSWVVWRYATVEAHLTGYSHSPAR